MNPTFDPPLWAEKMKLRVNESAGVPKAGARIRCPIHLREHMLEFHTKLYDQGYIQPATDCESYAPVLVIRKPDTAEGKPRGFRFVVDLRNRNNTIHGMASVTDPPASRAAVQRHRIRKPGYPGYAISGSAS